MRSIYKANRTDEQRQCLDDFLEDFEVLKFEIRLLVDLHLMTVVLLLVFSPLL